MGERGVVECTNNNINNGRIYLHRAVEPEIDEFLQDLIFLGYETDSFHFLQNLGIIDKSAKCPHCNIMMTWSPSESVDLFKWTCQQCGKTSSVREGSLLLNIDCSYDKILAIMMAWCDSEGIEDTAMKYEMEPSTVAKIFSMLAAAAVFHIMANLPDWKIGGPGVIVLIDTFPETHKFDKQKIDRQILCLGELQAFPFKIVFHPLEAKRDGQNDLDANNSIMNSFIRDLIHPESIVVARKNAAFCSFEDIALNHPQFSVLTSDEVLLRHESEGRSLRNILSIIWEKAFDICMEAQFYPPGLMGSFLYSHMWREKFRSRSHTNILCALANLTMVIRDSDETLYKFTE